jgi:hypothetical protein
VDRSLPSTFVSVATRIVTRAKRLEPAKNVRGESGSPKINHALTDVQHRQLRVLRCYNETHHNSYKQMDLHQWAMAYQGICFFFWGGGGVQQIKRKTQGRENEDLGAVTP